MKIIIFLIGLIVIAFHGSGQNYGKCGSDEMHDYFLKTDSIYREHFSRLESQIEAYVKNQGNDKVHKVVNTIPVVVHVIHLGEAIGTESNISDIQIQEAINGLNDRYKNTIGNGLDVEINFCLAVQDPNGNFTTGINRIDGSGMLLYQTGGVKRTNESDCNGLAEEDTIIKNLIRWPASDYYNIWVVSEICGGWAGYAYYPSGSAFDGTVMDYNYMKYSSTTLTHEIGHAFYLYHTFMGDNEDASCPADTLCTSNGDKVCDTPPHKRNDCGAYNPCTTNGIWDNSLHNYMSYCGASRDRFTPGQKNRMNAVVTVYPRVDLLTSPGCISVTDNISDLPLNPDNKGCAIPNPNNGKFHIQPQDMEGKIKIYNSIGKLVYENDIQKEINVSDQPGGIYFVHIEGNSLLKEKILIADF